MNRKLSDIPIEELRTLRGAAVMSITTGNLGKITFVSDVHDGEDFTIDIFWDYGAKSIGVWHHWLENVTLV